MVIVTTFNAEIYGSIPLFESCRPFKICLSLSPNSLVLIILVKDDVSTNSVYFSLASFSSKSTQLLFAKYVYNSSVSEYLGENDFVLESMKPFISPKFKLPNNIGTISLLTLIQAAPSSQTQ